MAENVNSQEDDSRRKRTRHDQYEMLENGDALLQSPLEMDSIFNFIKKYREADSASLKKFYY